jgi:hypothetical protein
MTLRDVGPNVGPRSLTMGRDFSVVNFEICNDFNMVRTAGIEPARSEIEGF